MHVLKVFFTRGKFGAELFCGYVVSLLKVGPANSNMLYDSPFIIHTTFYIKVSPQPNCNTQLKEQYKTTPSVLCNDSPLFYLHIKILPLKSKRGKTVQSRKKFITMTIHRLGTGGRQSDNIHCFWASGQRYGQHWKHKYCHMKHYSRPRTSFL